MLVAVREENEAAGRVREGLSCLYTFSRLFNFKTRLAIKCNKIPRHCPCFLTYWLESAGTVD